MNVTPGKAIGVGSAVFFVKKDCEQRYRVYPKSGSKAKATVIRDHGGHQGELREDILREVLAATKRPLKYVFTVRAEGGWHASAQRGHLTVVPETVIETKADAAEFARKARRAAEGQASLADLVSKFE